VVGEAKVSFRDLNERANRLAHFLSDQAIGRGSLVGIMMDRSVDLVVSLLAVLKAGAAFVPLDPDYPQDRLEHMISDAGLAGIIVASPSDRRILSAGSRPIVLEEVAPLLNSHPAANPRPARAADDLAYVIYTSGSTGRPRGSWSSSATC
jgi:non-ribosomal peptide synthetase component F